MDSLVTALPHLSALSMHNVRLDRIDALTRASELTDLQLIEVRGLLTDVGIIDENQISHATFNSLHLLARAQYTRSVSRIGIATREYCCQLEKGSDRDIRTR